jgi:hypothetical protein
MERETTGVRRAHALPLVVDIPTGTFSMAGSQSPPGRQAFAIANIAAAWIVITTRRRQVRVHGVASIEPYFGNAWTHRVRTKYRGPQFGVLPAPSPPPRRAMRALQQRRRRRVRRLPLTSSRTCMPLKLKGGSYGGSRIRPV